MIIFSAALLLTRTCLQQSMQRCGKNASDIDEQSTGLSSAGQTRKFSDLVTSRQVVCELVVDERGVVM
jgi:hypothetical protein